MLAQAQPDRYGDPCSHREPWITDIPVDGVLQDVVELLTPAEGRGTAG